MTSGGNNINDSPENQMTKNAVGAIRTFPGGQMTTFGGGKPNTGGRMAFRSVPAEFNHCLTVSGYLSSGCSAQPFLLPDA